MVVEVGKGLSGLVKEGRGFLPKKCGGQGEGKLSTIFHWLGVCVSIFACESPSLLYTFVINIVAVTIFFLYHCCFQ